MRRAAWPQLLAAWKTLINSDSSGRGTGGGHPRLHWLIGDSGQLAVFQSKAVSAPYHVVTGKTDDPDQQREQVAKGNQCERAHYLAILQH